MTAPVSYQDVLDALPRVAAVQDPYVSVRRVDEQLPRAENDAARLHREASRRDRRLVGARVEAPECRDRDQPTTENEDTRNLAWREVMRG